MKLRFRFIIIIIFLLIFTISLILAISESSQNFCMNEKNTISSECYTGCCTDARGIEHEKYPKKLCQDRGGKFYEGSCRNSFVCD